MADTTMQEQAGPSTTTPFPPQQTGKESEMEPRPVYIRDTYKGTGKLKDKVAIVTGGDSGIGRAVAVHFAREGANVMVAYNKEHSDARETQMLVEQEGRRCFVMPGDVGSSTFCNELVVQTIKEFGRLDIVVNNAAQQQPTDDIAAMDPDLMARTFRTNIYAYIYLSRAAWPHLGKGSSIINTSSVTAYKGHSQLLDYSATKGAIVAFTRALSNSSLSTGKGVRVNSVAPGPIWTPLITATFPPDKVATFGKDVPMGRAGQPFEVAPTYVFLASQDSSFISGQVMHPNGGTIVNS